jgi:ankyrin repeat protein
MRNRDYEKNQGLVGAVADGQLDQVRKILENFQGDINSVVDEFGTPLTVIAAKRNDFSLLKVLATKGASLTASDPLGCTPLDWAKRNKNKEMIEVIMSGEEKISGPRPG